MVVETRRWDACKLRRSWRVGETESILGAMKLATVTFYGFVLGLLAVGLRELLTGFEENRCTMTYMFEYPEYRVSVQDRLHHWTPQYWLHRLASSAANQLSRSAASSLAALMLTFDNNVEWINQCSVWIWTHVSRQTRSQASFRTPANVKSEVTVRRNPASVFITSTHSSVWFKGEVCSYLRNTREGLTHIISRVAELQSESVSRSVLFRDKGVMQDVKSQ